MDATPRKVINLFELTLRYVVPIFQRHYVWDAESQWAPLWEDIQEKLTQRQRGQKTTSHFLGAVILDAAKKKSTKETSRFVVIDGQQRITTIQLLFAALRDYALKCGVTKISNAVGRALFNPDPELMENSAEEIFKLWPTQFNRKVFCDILKARGFDAVNEAYPIVRKPRRRRPEPRDRLVEAYIFFYNKIDELCAPLSELQAKEDALLELYSVFRDDFAVVEIILGENDNSQEIFNSLNAHGKPLSQSDLLRSFVFMRAEKSNEDRDWLFDKYWSRFEDTFWDIQVRRGSIWSSHLDWATRTFLSSKLGLAVDARKVHLEYMNWIRASQPYARIEDELKDFAAYGNRFRSLVEPSGEDAFSEFARRLNIWDVTTAYPLVIYLFEEANLTGADALDCLHTIESFVVRRLICHKDNKEYNQYFPEIIGRLRQVGASKAALKQVLADGAGATREWPTDPEFEQFWCTSAVYEFLKSAQIATILKQIEERSRTTKTEKISVPTASVEHVMPQEWADHYLLKGEVVPKELSKNWFFSSDKELVAKYDQIKEVVQARNRAIQRFGNLTLVTQPLNSAMQNGPFAEKKVALRNSLLLLNRYFDGIEAWDEPQIERRAKSLFQVAKELWPRG